MVDEASMGLKSKTVGSLALFALLWNGIVGIFDGVIAYGLDREYDARTRFEQVDARVMSSNVDTNGSGDQDTYKPMIEFQYEFDGIEYQSDQYSFLSVATSDRGFAEAACEQYPLGAVVTAHVDPDDPMEAVLDVSGKSFPTAVLLFLMPFQLIGLGTIAWLIAAIRSPGGRTEEEELRERFIAVDTGEHVVFGKARLSGPAIALYCMTGLTFIATFIVIPFYGMGAGAPIVATALAVCGGLSAAFAAWRVKKGKAPENFLHIDRTRGTFSYPANLPGEPLESIQSIVHEPRPTGVTINDVVQFKHSFEAETPGGLVKLFDVRSSREEGDELLRLLREELIPR